MGGRLRTWLELRFDLLAMKNKYNTLEVYSNFCLILLRNSYSRSITKVTSIWNTKLV